MQSPLCTIVIPAYNAEKAICRMLDSVISQTYQNWELIVVNDGSKDGTLGVLRDYCSRDSRIHYIDKENEGAGSSRMKGISQAKGKYICLVDADDKLLPNYLERLVTEMELSGADMVWCNCYCNDESHVWNQNYEENPDTMIRGMLLHTQWAAVWNRIYKTDVAKRNARYFRELNQWDDMAFNVSYLLECKMIKHIPDALYIYDIESPGSLIHTAYKRNLIAEYKLAIRNVEEALTGKGKNEWYEYELNYSKLLAVKDYIDHKLYVDYDKFVSTYPEAIKNINKYPIYPTRLKICCWFIQHKLSIFVPLICKVGGVFRRLGLAERI